MRALPIIIILVIGVAMLCWLWYREGKEAEAAHAELSQANGRAELLRQQADERAKAIGKLIEDPRYEVMIADWAEEEGEHWEGNPMRFRWVVFDANRYLYQYANPNPLYGEQMETIMDPLMLGNAPTRAEAEAQAMAWVVSQNPDTAVVVS